MSATKSNPRVADIRDFGAVRGNPTATRQAIQAAHDSLADPSGLNRPGVVYIPGGDPWAIDRPVYLDLSGIGLRGDPLSGSAIEMDWHQHASCFLIGMPRVAIDDQGKAWSLTPDHFIDLYGKLDATAASAPGQRWGIRTNGNAHVAQGAGPLSYGLSNFSAPDYWGKTTALTVEFAFDGDLTPFEPTDAVYLGLSDRGKPQPFILISQLGRFVVYFKTSDGKLRGFNFAPPVGVGVKRIAFQIDLENATASAFVDGNQVAVDDNALGGDFTAGSGLTFTPNLNVPFKFASAGFEATNPGTDWWTDSTRRDRTLYGLRISNAVRYAVGSPGEPQRRLDGRPVNDFYSYFDLDMQTVALFPFQDDPAQVIKDRFLTVQALAGRSVALYLSAAHASTFNAKLDISIRDLSITSHDPAYGEAVTLGFAIRFQADRCRFQAGGHGVGTWNWGSNYKSLITNCRIDGNDAAIYSYYAMMTVRDIEVDTLGRSAFWFNMSRVYLSSVMCGYGGTPEYFIRSVEGTELDVGDFTTDIEAIGGAYPSLGGFLAESSTRAGGPTSGRFVARGLNLGTFGKGTALVRLTQASKDDQPAWFELEGVRAVGSDYKAIVAQEAANWAGVFRSQGAAVDAGVMRLWRGLGCKGVDCT